MSQTKFEEELPRKEPPALRELGDYTTDRRVVLLSVLAIGIGVIASYVAVALLRLIAFFTNIFFFQRFSFAAASPAAHMLGWGVIVVPVIGGLIVGVMARWGSDKIRGHGIPEAIESILMSGSRVEPKLAILKPLSAAIAIGSGGPFGAEGPIIMTGGAFGSLIAQFIHLSASERKTLLVAGSAAGMAATFATPLAGVLLAVELLLFEWKPRSFIPVALASVAAGAARRYLLGLGPLFPVPPHPAFINADAVLGCVVAGIGAGLLSIAVTQAIYAVEDGFHRLPIHWMWWPAIGGIAVGIGGLLFPQALGVGYDTIGALLQGDVPRKVFAGVLLVKSSIWAISLGSGTSGGVLAPVMMMGGALGGVEGSFLPHVAPGFWPLVSLGAVLAGTMSAPLTGIVFAVEVTHDLNMILPVMITVTVAYAISVLSLRRSILTEKIARRGYHLTREYDVDPLEILFVREVVRTNVVALPSSATAQEARALIGGGTRERRGQRLYPVVDAEQRLVGLVTRTQLEQWLKDAPPGGRVSEIVRRNVVVTYTDEPLRSVVQRMAETGLTRFPVVERGRERHLVGMISLADTLRARKRNLEAEQRRERVLSLRLTFPRRLAPTTAEHHTHPQEQVPEPQEVE